MSKIVPIQGQNGTLVRPLDPFRKMQVQVEDIERRPIAVVIARVSPIRECSLGTSGLIVGNSKAADGVEVRIEKVVGEREKKIVSADSRSMIQLYTLALQPREMVMIVAKGEGALKAAREMASVALPESGSNFETELGRRVFHEFGIGEFIFYGTEAEGLNQVFRDGFEQTKAKGKFVHACAHASLKMDVVYMQVLPTLIRTMEDHAFLIGATPAKHEA